MADSSDLRELVQAALPNISESLLEEVLSHLLDVLGVESVDDMGEVMDTDFPMLKPIQARKLVKYAKGKSCLNFPLIFSLIYFHFQFRFAGTSRTKFFSPAQ